MELDEFRPSPDWEKVRNDLALGTAVRASVAVDERVGSKDREIEISASDGVITIGGKVESLLDAERIQAVIREIPGVKDAAIKVGFFKPDAQIL